MFQTKLTEKIKTHILCPRAFFLFSENRVVYEICGKILYSRAGHRWQHGAGALHARYL